jgi:DNA-binding response OmpR family regulator
MRLLLAEDEQELSHALVTVLKHNNYSVDAVYNGQDALDYINVGNYDGAILDIMMPKMDGITVLKKVRAAGNSIPILMLTAKAEIDDRVLGLDSGADDYLTKPFSMKELLARIRAMTRRQTDATDSVLSFGNIALDRSKFLLSSPKESLRLANKEFQMLEMLLVHPGQVISADQFMEKIWGYDSDAEQNVVWVYISYLRKKLAALDATVTIRAVRGLGYTLEESHD